MVNNDSHYAILMDIAVPADTKIVSKETEKIVKCHDLCIKLKRLKSINVIPIVIGCLGSFSPNLLKYLKELPKKHPIAPLVKTIDSIILSMLKLLS